MPATAMPHELDEVAILRACVRHSPPALAVQARPGGPRVAWVSPGVAELLALDDADVLHRDVDGIGPALFEPAAGAPSPRATDDMRPDWRVAVRRILASGEPGTTIASVRRPDDSSTTVQVEVHPVAPGSPIWLVVLDPIHEARIRLQESLAESEQRFSALADHAPIGIVMSRAGLRLGYVNRFLASLAGLPAANLLGTGWLDMLHSEDLPEVYETVQAVLAGEPGELTARLTPVGDAQRWVHLRFAPVTTPRRAAGFVATVEDITSRRAWEEQLAYQACHDSLTGLFNRRRIVEELTLLLESRRAFDHDFAVLFCDLDGFKQVNDTWGHDAGDRVLIEVGRLLSRTAREQDLVARLAGDEFVVLLRHVEGETGAESAARRHLQGLSGEVSVRGRRVRLSASLGVALPGPGDTAESLLRTADRMMYLAKEAGPGQYMIASGRTTDQAVGPAPCPPPAEADSPVMAANGSLTSRPDDSEAGR